MKISTQDLKEKMDKLSLVVSNTSHGTYPERWRQEARIVLDNVRNAMDRALRHYDRARVYVHPPVGRTVHEIRQERRARKS